MLPPRLWVVAYLRHAVTGGMPSPGTLCCARVPGYGRVSSLRDDGQCAWSVAHLRSAWLWGRPASPCAIRWARRANGVMGEWRAAGASQPSAVSAMVWDGWRFGDALLRYRRRKGDSLYVRCQCALLHSWPSNFLLDDFA